jgi:hypothetical protein
MKPSARTVFQHDRVDNRDRGGRQSHSRKPALHRSPAEYPVCNGGTPEDGRKEAYQTDGHGFLPASAESHRVKFCAREKGEHNRSGSGKECDPGRICCEDARPEDAAENKLCECSDDYFRQGGGDAKPDGEECRKKC